MKRLAHARLSRAANQGSCPECGGALESGTDRLIGYTVERCSCGFERSITGRAVPKDKVSHRGRGRAKATVSVRARILLLLPADVRSETEEAESIPGTTVGAVAAATSRDPGVVSAHLLQLCETGRARRERCRNPAYPHGQGARPLVWMYWRIA